MSAPADNGPALWLAGATATGKSDAALRLARRLNGEIVSVDSMQVYRGLNIGTAKPTSDERQSIPHHLVDVIQLREPFDAAQFVALATKAMAEIRSRGALPILCGGTGLYFNALLDGLGEAPPADPILRAALEKLPLESLIRELEKGDPITFGKIDQKNPRRVVRAVEILRLTGRPPSSVRASWSTLSATAQPNSIQRRVFVLRRHSADIQARIDARVDQMFAAGLVEETRQLLTEGLTDNRTALQAIGYRQVVEYLKGERSLNETIALVKIRTRQFAKRQMTWFRRQLPVHWIDVEPSETGEALAEQIAAIYLESAALA